MLCSLDPTKKASSPMAAEAFPALLPRLTAYLRSAHSALPRLSRLWLGRSVVGRRGHPAMYDPSQSPFVSHTRGTQLVIEHIEKYWCPSIASDDLRQVIPGSDDPVTK